MNPIYNLIKFIGSPFAENYSNYLELYDKNLYQISFKNRVALLYICLRHSNLLITKT